MKMTQVRFSIQYQGHLNKNILLLAFFMIPYLLMICTAFANSITWVVAVLNVVIFHVVVLNVTIHTHQAIVIVLRNVNLPYKPVMVNWNHKRVYGLSYISLTVLIVHWWHVNKRVRQLFFKELYFGPLRIEIL